jgi:GntR family transcriptional regulator, sialic acid-inducible nan operon repressor
MSSDWLSLNALPVRRRKLYEEVVDRIEAAILSGEIAQDSVLPSERELTKLFGVGRTAVREALFALERKGFVSLSNGECARVSRPDPKVVISELSGAAKHFLMEPSGVEHFQKARILFESGLARCAAEIATDEQIESLSAALDANKRALGDQVAFDRTDMDFHFVIAEISRNPIFNALYLALSEWLYEQRAIAGMVKGGPEAAYEAHAKIFRAIAAKDSNAAGEAMREHLEEISKRYWRLKNEAAASAPKIGVDRFVSTFSAFNNREN